MASGVIKGAQNWIELGGVGPTEVVYTMPRDGTFLCVTGHNATYSLNTLWILRTGAAAGGGVWLIGAGGTPTTPGTQSTVTITNMGDRQFKFKTDGGTANVYIVKL